MPSFSALTLAIIALQNSQQIDMITLFFHRVDIRHDHAKHFCELFCAAPCSLIEVFDL